MRLHYSILLLCESEMRLSMATIVLRCQYHVIPVTTTKDAIAALKERPFDLVVIYYSNLKHLEDVMMVADCRNVRVLGVHNENTDTPTDIGVHLFGTNMETIRERIKTLISRKRGPKKVAA